MEKRINELDVHFLNQLDCLLKRRVLTEQEFARANEVARSEKVNLEARKEELANLLKQDRVSEALIEKVPRSIKTLEQDFQSLEPCQQKAQL
jgi:hypothetical protein